MSKRRVAKVQEAIREELAQAVLSMKDHRLGFVTITRVEVSSDLQYAKVFFSVMDRENEADITLEALDHARGYLQGLLGPTLRLRSTPQLRFVYDHSGEVAADLLETIRKARASDPHPPSDDDDQPDPGPPPLTGQAPEIPPRP